MNIDTVPSFNYSRIINKDNINYSIKYLHHNNSKLTNNLYGGGITVAYITTPDGIYYSIAECSVRDIYNKETGRRISSIRLYEYVNNLSDIGILLSRKYIFNKVGLRDNLLFEDKPINEILTGSTICQMIRMDLE